MANCVDPDQTAPIGAVCSGSTLFASILNSSVMLGKYLQQTTSVDAFFLGALRANAHAIRTKISNWTVTLIGLKKLEPQLLFPQQTIADPDKRSPSMARGL